MTLLKESIIGSKFNHFTIKSIVGVGGMVICQCECGKLVKSTYRVIKIGSKKSCGCIKFKNRFIHGQCANKNTKEYTCWLMMKKRCIDEKSKDYKNYGGRGVMVCDRWIDSFPNFLEDMGFAPNLLDSIDRIDVNGNYEPSNCRWADRKTQANTKRNNRKLTFGSRTENLSWWCDFLKCRHSGILKQLPNKSFDDIVMFYSNKHNIDLSKLGFS